MAELKANSQPFGNWPSLDVMTRKVDGVTVHYVGDGIGWTETTEPRWPMNKTETETATVATP